MNRSINSKSTDELLKMIQDDPGKFAKKISSCNLEFDKPQRFTELLTQYMDSRNVKSNDLVISANLSKPYIYNLLSGARNPGRNIVFRIALALGLNFDETQNLLKSAEKPVLSPKVRRDAGIICCLLQGYNPTETDEYLRSIDEDPLFEE